MEWYNNYKTSTATRNGPAFIDGNHGESVIEVAPAEAAATDETATTEAAAEAAPQEQPEVSTNPSGPIQHRRSEDDESGTYLYLYDAV